MWEQRGQKKPGSEKVLNWLTARERGQLTNKMRGGVWRRIKPNQNWLRASERAERKEEGREGRGGEGESCVHAALPSLVKSGWDLESRWKLRRHPRSSIDNATGSTEGQGLRCNGRWSPFSRIGIYLLAALHRVLWLGQAPYSHIRDFPHPLSHLLPRLLNTITVNLHWLEQFLRLAAPINLKLFTLSLRWK